MIAKTPLIINNAPANTIEIEPLKLTDAVDFGKNDHTAAVRPGIEVEKSRENMRKYMKNAAKAVTPLQIIVDDFVKYVKKAPPEITYGEIYSHFLDLWFKECETLRARKIKAVIIDSHWFAMQYAPQI